MAIGRKNTFKKLNMKVTPGGKVEKMLGGTMLKDPKKSGRTS